MWCRGARRGLSLRKEGGGGRHIGTGKFAMSQITLIPLKGAYEVLGDRLGIAPLGTGPAGTRSPATGSNAWSIMSLTEVPDAAWGRLPTSCAKKRRKTSTPCTLFQGSLHRPTCSWVTTRAWTGTSS